LNGYSQSYEKLVDSDSLTIKFWTIEDGLPINTVNQVVQDDDGYLWFTSYDGIIRFDGVEFKTFNHANTPEIPHNRATEIHKQNGVGIWVSMEHEGVLLITDRGFRHFGVEQGFSASDVTQIAEARGGAMFFVTHTGLYTYEDGQFRKFFNGKDNWQDQPRFFFEDVDGSKWISTSNGLIHALNDGSFEEHTVADNREENIFFTSYRNSEGTFFASSSSGLYVLEDGKLTAPKEFDVFKNSDVYRIFEIDETTILSSNNGLYSFSNGNLEKLDDLYRKDNEAYRHSMIDSDGQLWLIGNQGTVSIFRDGRITDNYALTSTGLNFFMYAFEDQEKNIWVTTPREGIIRIKKALVRTIGSTEGLSEGNILGMLQDSRGRYWIGTRGGGLNLIEGNQIKHFKEHRDIASSVVQSIAEDSLGNIWVGHYQKGLNRINDRGISHFTLGENFNVNNIHALYTSKDGQLWVGSYGGLIKFSEEESNRQIYTVNDGLAGNKIRYITEAKDGSLWIGTLDGGVSHFRDNKFTNYTAEEGLSSNNIRSIYLDEDDSGIIWVGTENNGLNRIKNGSITYIGVEDGLPNYNIHWISEDDKDWLWLSSNNGIIRIEKSSLSDYMDGKSHGFKMMVYGRNEGMRNPEGNGSIQEAGIKDSDGTFWFATQEGVAIFKNDLHPGYEVEPKVIVKEVLAGGESHLSDSLVFVPSINDFEVIVHAITFINPSSTRFRYKFSERGDDRQEWEEIGRIREIQFTNIDPGEYQFTVQATNSEGIWSSQTASVFIEIKPKYYQQVWFYILCFFGFLALLTGGWKIRYRRLMGKQQEMEKIIEEQTKQLRQEKIEIQAQKEIIEKQAQNLEQSNNTKDKFFSIIAHDLRNPFQALMGYTEHLYTVLDHVDKKELKESIGIIKDSSKTLLSLTENLLEWANLQTGKIKPEPVGFELSELISQCIDVFKQTASQKNIKIVHSSEEEVSLYADRNMILTVLRNLISNAIKFTTDGGEVTITTIQKENYCTIKVSDTGIGMSTKILKGVLSLDLKTTRRGTNEEAGTGLGLVLCKEMVEMNNGSLEVDSKEGQGTTVSVILPSDNKSS